MSIPARGPRLPEPQALHAALERAGGAAADARVALLARPRHQALVQKLVDHLPGVHVDHVDAGLPMRGLHVRLAAGGPYDVVLDLAVKKHERRREVLLRHLRPGGTWLARGALDDAVVQTEDVLAVVRDREMADVLALDPSRGRVLATVAPQTWEVRSAVRASGPFPSNPMPKVYEAPGLALREYTDVVCLPRQVAISRRLVLPESFTTVEDHRQRNVALTNVGINFVRDVSPAADPPLLRGRWFHLDTLLQWHFGHVVSEQLSHLWGWQRAKAEDPGLRALLFTETGVLDPWQRDLLAAGGVSGDDLHVATSPVRVESLVGCTPMFSRPAYIHPDLRPVYDGIGAQLSARAPARDWPERVFFSRRSTKRACRNAEELLEEFTAAGFTVIYPEDHPMAAQAEFARRASAVAGFAGSGMLHIGFAGGPRHVILVCSESYPAHNEYLISALMGHRLDIVVCRAQVPRGDGFSRESFHSDYTYDPGREGAFLRSVLGDLP